MNPFGMNLILRDFRTKQTEELNEMFILTICGCTINHSLTLIYTEPLFLKI